MFVCHIFHSYSKQKEANKIEKPEEEEDSDNDDNEKENFTWIKVKITANSEKNARKIVLTNFENYTNKDLMWSSTKEEINKENNQITFIYWTCEIEDIQNKVNIKDVKANWKNTSHSSSELIHIVFK